MLARALVPEGTPFWSSFIILICGIGAILTCAVNGAFIALTGMIRRDTELNEALNNEMFRHYTNKSAVWAYYAVMVVGLTLGAVTWLGEVDIPAPVCCLAILFAGTLAQSVALIVYDRSR